MGDLGKIIVAIGFEKLPKVQKIAQSGHTRCNPWYPFMTKHEDSIDKIDKGSVPFKEPLGQNNLNVFFEFGKGSNLGNLTTFILLMEQIFNALSDPN